MNADSIIDSDAGMLGYNLFAYCGNNPVNRTDPSGMFWKEIGDWFNKTWNSVTTWASNTFGVETSTTVIEAQNKEKEELDFLFFKISKAENVSYDIETGSSKAVTVYANTTSPKVGIKANVGNVTGNIGTGLDGLLTEKLSIKSQDTTYSFGYSEKVLWSDFSFAISSGNYSQTYTLELNKWRIALAATAPYLLPISNSEHLVRVFN